MSIVVENLRKEFLARKRVPGNRFFNRFETVPVVAVKDKSLHWTSLQQYSYMGKICFNKNKSSFA